MTVPVPVLGSPIAQSDEMTRVMPVVSIGISGFVSVKSPKISEDAIEPIRPHAAWMPKAVDRTWVGKSSTIQTSSAFQAETETPANTQEKATTPSVFEIPSTEKTAQPDSTRLVISVHFRPIRSTIRYEKTLPGRLASPTQIDTS